MTESEKDTESGSQSVPQRKARHIWPYLLHILIFISYSVTFLTATSFWTYQEIDRTVAYSMSSVSKLIDLEASELTPYLLEYHAMRVHCMRIFVSA